MKSKKIIFIFLFCLVLLLISNILTSTYYETYTYNTLNSIINNITTSHPELEPITIDTILTENPQPTLSKYGLNPSNLRNIPEFKQSQNQALITTSLCFLAIISFFFLIYYFHNQKLKKEITTINNYLKMILKGTYELNIADYNEDELSLLKNDIYKVTIKLKELSEYERNEKNYLMHTLEDISHQLKTPLTALMVTNDILMNNDLTPEEQSAFLTKESKELTKMEWLITTLLKYSKLDSGSVKLKKESIKASVIINDIIESLSIPLELKNITVTTENLNFYLNCDINWTKEAILNIIKNACDHLKPSGTITITGEDNPIYTALSITDNGPGIKKSDIKKIFDRFYSTNSTQNSIGIGLNMAKLIIERQNGKIEVTSMEGQSTTFQIIFYKKNY